MQLFYGTDIEDNHIILSEQESAHCIRVLRMKIGDTMDITDGKGNFYKGIIQTAHDKRTSVEILDTRQSPSLPYQLNLFVAITKQADRLEWMLEKCVEMGLCSFTPIISQRTERKNIRVDRLELIALSAMKQSLKAWLPSIHSPLKFNEALVKSNSPCKLIAHCNDGVKVPMINYQDQKSVDILIGPEGDFTNDEVALAIKNGFHSVSMGESRLRTETAGLMACSFMYWYNINTQ